MVNKILIDTNVLLDYLLEREPIELVWSENRNVKFREAPTDELII